MEEQNITEHTGFPNPATDTTLTSLDIGSYLVKHPASTFFMRINGHTWERYGIFHQDIAIIDRSLSPNATDLVVWWNESGFTIKRFSNVPIDSPVWGVITFIIHGYRL